MEEWVPVIFHPGEPDSAIAESARERAWEDFVVRGREPAVAPVVRDSWVRSRDVFQIDPALKRSPIVLSEDEWCRRRERLEPLSAGIPVLERFGEDLRETQDMLALCDADGYVLVTAGHPRVIEETTEINLRVGGSWNEQVAGTNGIGTALAEGRTVQVIGAEHYVGAWQRWVCTGAPIRHPITGETLAVIDVTGYKERSRRTRPSPCRRPRPSSSSVCCSSSRSTRSCSATACSRGSTARRPTRCWPSTVVAVWYS